MSQEASSRDPLAHCVSKLHQTLLNPNSILEQANAVRGMIVTIDALLHQGLLSQEAATVLSIKYRRMLDELWVEDGLVEKYNATMPNPVDNVSENDIERDFDVHEFISQLKNPESSLMSADKVKHSLQNHIVISKFTKESSSRDIDPKNSGSSSGSESSGSRSAAKETGFSSAKSVLIDAGGTVPSSSKSPGNLDNLGMEEKILQLCSLPELNGIEPELAKIIMNDMMTENPKLTWNNIAGLEYAKKAVNEMVVWPLLRPDIFTGPREPPKAMLLFGPPGTGKTLIGKCIASQANATFFSVSASSLGSKWLGESEKLVKTLFAVARAKQPSVVFFDELDSLLSKRDGSTGSDRKVKTEFLVQLDGARVYEKNQVVVLGATNRPYDLDEAARRRFVRRIYIGLPNRVARTSIIRNMFKTTRHSLNDDQLAEIAQKTAGFSGADMASLCREAALTPVRENAGNLANLSLDQIRPLNLDDLDKALSIVKASVSAEDLAVYEDWNRQFGCCAADSFD